jgi:uncharacterized protein YqgV (UPF0045/DUF77 family)
MSEFAAQVSLYPLGQDDLSPAIDEVLHVFKAHGLRAETGPMSTVLFGEDVALFAALHEATLGAANRGKMVMVITVSNACAVPEAPSAATGKAEGRASEAI